MNYIFSDPTVKIMNEGHTESVVKEGNIKVTQLTDKTPLRPLRINTALSAESHSHDSNS